MEQLPATQPVSMTELQHSPSPALERLKADLRSAIQEGIDSGPDILAEDVFAELAARYATRGRKAIRTRGKCATR